MQFDVIIIGAGAAGMMCAAQAGQRDRRVLLVDHSAKIGERIRISGGGRCNFSNREVGPDNFLSQNPHFTRSALKQFSARDFLALVERHRIRHHEREHGQLFCDDSAQDIIELLQRECADGDVQWATGCEVSRIERHEADSLRFSVVTSEGTFHCTSLVIATGGLAAPKIGASPFGYKIAEQFNIPVVTPKPALVPLALAPETLDRLHALSGASFKAETRCLGMKKPRFREDVLLTHRGLSGPAILQVSSYWQMQEYGDDKKQPIAIDLLPDLDVPAWLEAHRHSNVLLANLLAEQLPRRFAQEWCALLDLNKPMAQLNKREMNAAIEALQGWSLMPSGTLGYAKAEVTLGGVDTRALSSKTMEATAVPGLYFIGEVVDVTGWLGGYNFQWAWSSGWAAGQAA